MEEETCAIHAHPPLHATQKAMLTCSHGLIYVFLMSLHLADVSSIWTCPCLMIGAASIDILCCHPKGNKQPSLVVPLALGS